MRLLGDVLTDDFALFLLGGIADDDLHEETVDLSLGEGIGAFLLDGVLCGHNEEGTVEGERVVADGDLALLHGLEQCGLHLCRGAVDFIGQDEVGEDGTLLDLELLVAGGVDHGADDVGGEKVGGELYAGVFCVDKLGKSLDCQGFGQTRNAFEENVAVAEQGNNK